MSIATIEMNKTTNSGKFWAIWNQMKNRLFNI